MLSTLIYNLAEVETLNSDQTNQNYMEIKTREVEHGTKITVETSQEVALSVISGGKERIYLPDEFSSDSTYYIEENSVRNHSSGFSVIHTDPIDEINVIAP